MSAEPTTLAIIGAGRVGRSMGRQLRRAGWSIRAVVTRSKASAKRAVRHIGSGRPYGKLTRLVLDARVVLIAVPDDAISKVAARLAQMGGDEWQGKVVLHTSGALDKSVLAPLENLGAATGSLHLMQSFSARVAPSFEGVWMVIEGTPKALHIARHMARDLGGAPSQIQGGDKQAYHAAGVFCAAHVLTMVEAGTRILTNAGFSRRQAASALLQLSRQVLLNDEQFGPRISWTGPAARGDFGTIAGHIQALARFPREYGEAYAAVHRLGARVLSRRPQALLAKLEPALRAKARKSVAPAGNS